MKNTMKKITILFAVIIMTMLFAVSASAATEGYYTYEVKNGNATITDVDASISGDITIPSTLGGYEVTAISNFAFSMCRGSNVIIPNTVKTIGDWAFSECPQLVSVTMTDSVTSIGKWAFAACTQLKDVTLSNSISAINDYTFYMCRSLSSIAIGNDVTTIGVGAFGECFGLTHINVNTNNQVYSSDEYGVLYNKNKTSLLMYPTGNNRKSYDIPESVTEIAPNAFGNCLLEKITISQSVTIIGSAAFANCYFLDNINIPSKITEIPNNAFNSCVSLRSITFSNSIKSIGDHAFHSSNNLTDIYFYGTKNEWNSIAISGNNTPILNATVHYLLEEPNEQETPENDNCSCNCHKGGISGFFFKILNFFQKLFGKNKVCACGVKH